MAARPAARSPAPTIEARTHRRDSRGSGSEPRSPGRPAPTPLRPGRIARAAGHTLNSSTIGVLPILDRLGLKLFLRDHLPREDRRCRIATVTGHLLLLKNLLVSREPLYGIGEWAARHVPERLGLSPAQLPALDHDRVGRCLDRLFDADIPTLTLAVVVHAVREFAVDLDELHNDSTTITFHGDYETADHERTLRGRLRSAVTWGHNKDHRPDLKHLLYILTVTRDGAVPVQFRVRSGNATDDRSHVATWDLLGKLTGRRDFLYVADELRGGVRSLTSAWPGPVGTRQGVARVRVTIPGWKGVTFITDSFEIKVEKSELNNSLRDASD